VSGLGEVDLSDAVVALRDLLAATERHVFGDECLKERDAARRALTAPPSRGAPGPTAMFHLAVATLERGAAIDQLTDDEIAVIVSAVSARVENTCARTNTQRISELERERFIKAAFYAHNPDEMGDREYASGHHDGVNAAVAAIRALPATGLSEGSTA
jgi:hypothetical protein